MKKKLKSGNAETLKSGNAEKLKSAGSLLPPGNPNFRKWRDQLNPLRGLTIKRSHSLSRRNAGSWRITSGLAA